MRIIFSIILATLLLTGGIVRAADTAPLFAVGTTYYARSFLNAPPPLQGNGTYSEAIVKILQYGIGQWYWVEYDDYHIPPATAKLPVTVVKKRVWLNFAQLTVVLPGKEVDYATTFPQGYKIVPYQEE